FTANLKTIDPSWRAKCSLLATVSAEAGLRLPPAFILRYGTPDPSVWRRESMIPKFSVVGSSKTAPPPSPNIIQVVLSSYLTMEDILSAPMIITFLCMTVAINWLLMVRAYKYPEQAAEMSNLIL